MSASFESIETAASSFFAMTADDAFTFLIRLTREIFLISRKENDKEGINELLQHHRKAF